ncbi:hypothetical protein BDW74DRAFT_91810 [Aspergillus multicolor]|uniref:uncharacterized protein n=1 Tax=Aspergillus multicolor TaxID=41759 RepID=UPI003CCDC660
MKSLVSFLAVYGASLCYAQSTSNNYFLSPGSQQAQLDSGNNTDEYPVYPQDTDFLFTWTTNWTRISLVLWQNENASALTLFENESDQPISYSYSMNPDVNLTWNDVFFATLWNENRDSEGGIPYFSSSYFRINATSPDPTSTTTSSTPTPTPGSNNTASDPQATNSSDDDGLDTGAKVGIGVGVGLGVPALALAGVAAFYFRKRAKTLQAQQQQLQQYPGAGGGVPGIGPYGPPPAPLSEVSGPAQFKPPAQWRGPSEVDAANTGVGVQSRFQELSGH